MDPGCARIFFKSFLVRLLRAAIVGFAVVVSVWEIWVKALVVFRLFSRLRLCSTRWAVQRWIPLRFNLRRTRCIRLRNQPSDWGLPSVGAPPMYILATHSQGTSPLMDSRLPLLSKIGLGRC